MKNTYPWLRNHLTTIAIIALSSGQLQPGTLCAADWPHWRGADRDGHTREDSGWDRGAWKSLSEAWRTQVGHGGSAPIVVAGRVYVIGNEARTDQVRCLDLSTGRQLWKQSYPAPDYGRHSTGDKGQYKGPSATPEFDPATGLLFTLGGDGDLRCWNTQAQGNLSWQLNLYDRFDIPRRPQVTKRARSLRDYGYTCAPLVHDDWLLVEVGDPARGNLLALDKRTGRPVWHSENRDPAGHSGGLSPLTVDGIPCVAVLTARNLVVTRLDPGHAGETLAREPWVTDFINNIPTPAVRGQDIIVTSKYNLMTMARLHVSATGINKVWQIRSASGVCSPVIDGDNVYWANRGMHCIDFHTGKDRWFGRRFGDAASCVMTADQRLIVWADFGDLALIESANRSPKEFKLLAERRKLTKATAWPHVVPADGRLLCKDRDGGLFCFSLQ